MELKVFRDVLPAAGADCTAKAELPLETELLISDYLPPVQRIVKCFAKPVVLQKQLAPGRLTLEGYLRCTVYYQGEEGAGCARPSRSCPSPRPSSCPLSRPRRGQPASRARPNTSTAGPSTPAASRCGGLRAGGERPRPAVHRGHHGPSARAASSRSRSRWQGCGGPPPSKSS